MNQQVDQFINESDKWREEYAVLRGLLLDCGLTEELKWKQPCYMYKGKNLMLMSAFKDACFISFFNGTLMSDTNKILVSPGENSQSVKYLKFKDLDAILKNRTIIKAYIYESIEIEKAGLKVDKKLSKNFVFPVELLEKFKDSPKFKNAFEGLSTGRQRAYNLFFIGAKQSKTRRARIEKHEQRILNGFGINDCTCGHSKRKPNCDGSHKYL